MPRNPLKIQQSLILPAFKGLAHCDAEAYDCGCISWSNSSRFAFQADDRTQSGEVAREDALDAITVRTMTADDEGPAIETLILAFAADPVQRWATPHPHQYIAATRRFVRAFGMRERIQQI